MPDFEIRFLPLTNGWTINTIPYCHLDDILHTLSHYQKTKFKTGPN